MILRSILNRVQAVIQRGLRAVGTALSRWTKPLSHSPILDTVADLAHSRSQLVAENLLLRQQLIVLQRSVKQPRFTRADRARFVLLASWLPSWKELLRIVKPATVLRWHRQGFRLFWKRQSHATSQEPKIPLETITLIKEMAANNRLWGAERIHGALLKVGITVAKRTVQRSMRQARPSRPRGQTWATFVRNHATAIWACDVLQVTDVFFRPLVACFITDLASRRIVQVGVTRCPSDAWVAQQLREATPFGEAPKYLMHDHDAKYGAHFAAVAAGIRIAVLRTPGTRWVKAPRANAICERLLGSLRRECLEHVLIVSEAHLRRVLTEYGRYFNRSRPGTLRVQGINQRVPEAAHASNRSVSGKGRIVAFPVLGGLHHEYSRVA